MYESNLNEMLGSNLVVGAACPAVLYDEIPAREEEDVSPRSRKIRQWPDKMIPVLLASPDPEDHLILPEILGRSEWQWSRTRGYRQAERRLRRGPIGVVLCERDLSDGCWQDLLEAGRRLEKPPSFIVCSRLADELLWSKVLNLGGYDVLIKPFEREEVIRVVCAALRSWQRAYAAPSGGLPFPRVRTSGAGAL
jgi:DNA-binding response OmpR family regulator